MTGRKITLKNIGNTTAIFAYQTLSSLVWQYQVELLPGQTKTIFCVDGTFYYNTTQHNVSITENISFPPDLSTTTTTTSPIPNSNTLKSISILGVITGGTNWELINLNYQTVTTSVLNIGLSSSGWYPDCCPSFYPLTNSGYLAVLYSGDVYSAFFQNYQGDLLGTYSATTNDKDFGTLEGQFTYFIDRTNGVLKYSDGVTLKTINFDTNDDFDIDYSYDNAIRNGFMIYSGSNNYYSAQLVNMNSVTPIYNWDSNSYSVSIPKYKDATFVPVIVYTNSNQYAFLNIYSSTGSNLQQINLLSNLTSSIHLFNFSASTLSSDLTGYYYVTGSTTGSGVSAEFYVHISTVNVLDVTAVRKGTGFSIGDTITIDGTQFGGISGTDDIIITVTSLGDFAYADYDMNYYGKNQMSIVFYSNDDDTIPWLIYNYDGNTNTLVSTYHDRSVLYRNKVSRYNSFYGAGSEYPSQDIHYVFSQQDYTSNYDFYELNQCNILSFFSGDTVYREPYQLANDNNNTTNIAIYSYFLGTTFQMLYQDGPYLSLLTIASSGTSSTNVTLINSLDTFNFNYYWVGNKFVFSTYTNYSNDGSLYIYSANGVQLDAIPFTGGYDYVYDYDIFCFADNISGWYFNLVTPTFTEIGYFDIIETASYYYSPSNHNPGRIVFWNYGTPTSSLIVLTPSGITGTVSAPEPDCCFAGVNIGKDFVLYTYVNSGVLMGKVYTVDLSLIQTITFQGSDFETWEIIEDRIFVQTSDVSNYYNYLISPTTYKMVTMDNDDNWYLANDYTWWY